MQIKINLKIFIFIVLFFFTNQIKIYCIFMLFAFIHEIGHLIIGVIMGFTADSIVIKPVGVSIIFNYKIDDIKKEILKGNILELKKILISIAGPFTNLLIVIIYYYNNIIILGISREMAIYSNILIGTFNLLPIYPLDGGRILKGLIRIFLGHEKSKKYIKIISWTSIIVFCIFSSILILYIKNISLVLIVIYIFIINIKNNKD